MFGGAPWGCSLRGAALFLCPSSPRLQCQPGESGDVLYSSLRSNNKLVADMGSHILRLAFCLSLAAALAGCVIVPDQRHYAGGVVMVAPPPPREEVIGVAPVSGYVWMGGYWGWVGDRHEWVPGHWAPPRAGRHWVGHQWVRQGDGWHLRPGRWERGP